MDGWKEGRKERKRERERERRRRRMKGATMGELKKGKEGCREEGGKNKEEGRTDVDGFHS